MGRKRTRTKKSPRPSKRVRVETRETRPDWDPAAFDINAAAVAFRFTGAFRFEPAARMELPAIFDLSPDLQKLLARAGRELRLVEDARLNQSEWASVRDALLSCAKLAASGEVQIECEGVVTRFLAGVDTADEIPQDVQASITGTFDAVNAEEARQLAAQQEDKAHEGDAAAEQRAAEAAAEAEAAEAKAAEAAEAEAAEAAAEAEAAEAKAAAEAAEAAAEAEAAEAKAAAEAAEAAEAKAAAEAEAAEAKAAAEAAEAAEAKAAAEVEATEAAEAKAAEAKAAEAKAAAEAEAAEAAEAERGKSQASDGSEVITGEFDAVSANPVEAKAKTGDAKADDDWDDWGDGETSTDDEGWGDAGNFFV